MRILTVKFSCVWHSYIFNCKYHTVIVAKLVIGSTKNHEQEFLIMLFS